MHWADSYNWFGIFALKLDIISWYDGVALLLIS